MQLGLLTTFHNELLPHYIKKLQSKKFIKLHVIFSNQNQKLIEKDKKIFLERTKGYFCNLKLSDLKIDNINYHFVNNHNSKKTYNLIKKKKIKFFV